MRQRIIAIVLAVALVATGALCWQQYWRALRSERELVSILENNVRQAMTYFRHAAASGDPTERGLLTMSALSHADQAVNIILYLDHGPDRDALWLDAVANLTMGYVHNTVLDFTHKGAEADARLQGQADLLQSFLPLLEEGGEWPGIYQASTTAWQARPVRRSLFRQRLREFIEQNGLRSGPVEVEP